jgi:hypothetical protein
MRELVLQARQHRAVIRDALIVVVIHAVDGRIQRLSVHRAEYVRVVLVDDVMPSASLVAKGRHPLPAEIVLRIQ